MKADAPFKEQVLAKLLAKASTIAALDISEGVWDLLAEACCNNANNIDALVENDLPSPPCPVTLRRKLLRALTPAPHTHVGPSAAAAPAGLDANQTLQQLNETLSTICDVLQGVFRADFEPAGSEASTRVVGLRETAIDLYNLQTDGGVKCQMCGGTFSSNIIKGAHVYQRKWPSYKLVEMGFQTPDCMQNITVMCAKLEKQYDRFGLTAIPESDDLFRVYVLNPSLMDLVFAEDIDGKAYKFQDIHLRPMHFVSDARPAKRIVAFHASRAIPYAVDRKWLAPNSLFVPAAGWASPTFDDALRQRFLRDSLRAAMQFEGSESAAVQFEGSEADEVHDAAPSSVASA